MNLIYKYPILRVQKQEIELPFNSQILSFGHQENDMFIWAIVNTAHSKKQEVFNLTGTGHELPDGLYIGTVQLPNGLVFHLFQEVI